MHERGSGNPGTLLQLLADLDADRTVLLSPPLPP